jgi:hypothetical protein
MKGHMIEFILANRAELQFIAMVALCLAAFRWGKVPERIAALSVGSVFFLDLPYHAIFGAGVRFETIDVGHAVMDIIAGLLLTALALFANRFYPLCLASFQWLAITSHLVRDLNSEILPLAYALMMVVPSYMQQLVLTIGIAAHRRRERLHGPYRSWRTSWQGSKKTGRTSSTG